MPEGLLRIGELSRRTGLSRDVIRAWERRYDLLSPSRTQGNIRLYSVHDLSRLRLMQHYIGRGIPAAQAAGLVHQAQTAAHDSNPGLPPGDVTRARQILRESLERFDDASAARVLTQLLGIFAPGAVLRDVVLPYLRELGRRWECGRITVGQEHFASSFLEAWMLGLAQDWRRRTGPQAVIACLPGERHTLGLIVFGLALRDLGWRVAYLGADAPLPGVEHAAQTLRADAVVLACSLPATFAAAAGEVRDLADRLPVALGGSGIAESRAGWLGGRALAADPLVAAQALTAVVPPAPVSA